jgi:hypothetical protein
MLTNADVCISNRYSDDALLDTPPLLELARARVYVCTTLLGLDDPQVQKYLL